eukprot:895883-Prymnesium_polylepis.1
MCAGGGLADDFLVLGAAAGDAASFNHAATRALGVRLGLTDPVPTTLYANFAAPRGEHLLDPKSPPRDKRLVDPGR